MKFQDFKRIEITSGFWTKRLEMNSNEAIFYQWDQLEKDGSIDNFRIIKGEKKGERKGFFYSDSDVHKWAEAACHVYATTKAPELLKLIDVYIHLVESAMDKEGYLFTYNQIHFGNCRWKNLMIEHELYTFGHLIEAGIAHFQATKSKRLLELAEKSAQLILKDFSGKSASFTPGHEEIELALLKLSEVTKNLDYQHLAEQFIEKRGRIHFFALTIARQVLSQAKRSKIINKQNISLEGNKDNKLGLDFTENLQKKEPPLLKIRSIYSFLSGKYFQQHTVVRKMKTPVGHSVRWVYFATAVTKLAKTINSKSLLYPMKKAWDNMVTKRMYVTGGIGSLPVIEGFGKDYELHNEFAYCETCAAIGSIFWNHQLHLADSNAAYCDLTEWQLYNAASVGIALNGKAYLYRNPLESNQDLVRKEWFETSCCPSNVSRLWATLGNYIYRYGNNLLEINQYIENKTSFILDYNSIDIELKSSLPWEGNVEIKMLAEVKSDFTLKLRIPSWCKYPKVIVNNIPIDIKYFQPEKKLCASGYSPYDSYYISVHRVWELDNIIKIEFPMEVVIHRSLPQVKTNEGKVALSRGPLVYCLENIDNNDINIKETNINLNETISISKENYLLEGLIKLIAKNQDNQTLTFIPYFCWANREKSNMLVWVNELKV